MRTTPSQLVSGLMISIAAVLFSAPVLAERAPMDWLNFMGVAVQSTSYEGTVIRMQDGNAEALKVVRTIKDGVIMERVVAQEGNGLEIIRKGNEVHCILPDRKSVLVEEWDEQSTLFSNLPTSDIRIGSEYDVAIVRKERVAGRETILLAIRPHDGYRYGHRIWLDTETSFPLQTQLSAKGKRSSRSSSLTLRSTRKFMRVHWSHPTARRILPGCGRPLATMGHISKRPGIATGCLPGFESLPLTKRPWMTAMSW